MIEIIDILYKEPDEKLPKSLKIDLDKFIWAKDIPVGFGNLNSKVFRAIKEITGCEAVSCKLSPSSYKPVA